MNFTIEQKDKAAIFRPQEARLDSVIAPDLKAEFLILAQPDVETLVIDLTDVSYIDSAGLSALLLARRQQTSHEGDVRLVGVSEDVRSLLELTQLNRVFPIFETVQQALEAPQLSAVVTPEDDGESVLVKTAKVAAIGTGVAALGAIALGGDEDFEEEDDEEYENDFDESDDEDDKEYEDEEEDDDDEEYSDEEDGEEEEGDDEGDGEEEEDDDFEYEEDIEFEDDDEDEEDDDL
jgi:anti-anti-sigma factor